MYEDTRNEMRTTPEILSNRLIVVLLVTGLAGAILVGLGEFLEQYHNTADYGDPAYGYFAVIPFERIAFGHFLAVFSIPFYFPGYIGIFFLLNRALRFKPVSSWFMLTGGIYSITVGGIWLGMRASIALVQHSSSRFASVEDMNLFLTELASLNEPLINVVRVFMILVSVFFWFAFNSGKAGMPRWIVFSAPVIPLILIFTGYFLELPGSRFFLANAMNGAHIVFFGAPLTVFVYRYIRCIIGECQVR